MFALPQAKRYSSSPPAIRLSKLKLTQNTSVRRKDLYSPRSSPSSSPDPALEEAFRIQCAKLFDDIKPPSPAAAPIQPPAITEPYTQHESLGNTPHQADTPAAPQAQAQPQPQPFRLFLPSAHNPLPHSQPPDFPTHRPDSYYITAPITSARLAQLSRVALNGDDVRRYSLRACPGMAYPWRVVPCLSACDADIGDEEGGGDGEGEGEVGAKRKGRTRVGKKTRIKIRKRCERVRERERAKVVAEEGKAVHEREKRRRLNRVKQIRRREKERERKKGPGGDGALLVEEVVEVDLNSV